MRVMMVVSYDGSKFHGFQRQDNIRNVQGYLEKELSNILGEEILIKGSGRTDAGVHAMGQVVSFDTTGNIKGIKKILNERLVDVRVKKIKKVSDDFYARHSAKRKVYLYKLDLIGNKDHNYYGYYKGSFDLKKIKRISKLFLGTHDFHNFTSGDRLDYHSTIYKIRIKKYQDVLYFTFEGKAFYRYMVRNLVGSLLDAGKGKVNDTVIKGMLDNPDIDKRLTTASPNGLYLVKVKY